MVSVADAFSCRGFGQRGSHVLRQNRGGALDVGAVDYERLPSSTAETIGASDSAKCLHNQLDGRGGFKVLGYGEDTTKVSQ